MKLFFDTEFTGLYKNCKLVSIGIVSEDGKKFYAEVKDNFDDVDEWVQKNVIDILLAGTARWTNLLTAGVKIVHGTLSEIRVVLSKWLSQFDEIEFVSDVCHFDFVLLTDIFGTAFDLPKNVVPACYDINQDIAKYYNISLKEAFDISREKIAEFPDLGMKHNALTDALIIKVIYDKIN